MQYNNWQQQRLAMPITNDEWDMIRGLTTSESNNRQTDPVLAYQQPNQIVPKVLNIDYTKASNWFTNVDILPTKDYSEFVSEYTLSIPKLDIEDMNVIIGGEDLDKSLIHYPGTALPGEYGNVVIFGHSTLPILWNPANYLSVFTKLPSLEKGDSVYITYDGIDYIYIVDSYHEILPNEVDVLEQRFDRRTLTLITCVPPGTYIRRGVIHATLK